MAVMPVTPRGSPWPALPGAKLGPVAGPGDTIVVIEDDQNISDLVALYLRREGFRVLQARDGEQGIGYVERDRPKLVVVDVGLPGELDGFDVCRRLRAARRCPHRDAHRPRRRGRPGRGPRVRRRRLRHQALLAPRARGPGAGHPAPGRVAATHLEPTVLETGDVVIDTGRREVRQGESVVALTSREFDLLTYLALNTGLALSRRQLLDGVWGEGWYGDERTVDVHVRQLRKKLGDGLPLTTVWGVGYRLG